MKENTGGNKMKKILFLAIVICMYGSSVFAQSSANTTADVNIALIRGLTITTSGANTLNFGEVIVTGSAQSASITNANGQKFLITGHPNRSTTITYSSSVTLNNNAWVATNGGTQSTVTFTTNTADQTGSSSTYTDPDEITSGSSIPLPNVTGIGTLYLWIGGSIAIPANQPQGDYIGTLNVSVAY
jgi:hypothetical protein